MPVLALIDKAREKCHSDAELARRLGVSKALLSMMRKRQREVTPDIAALLADIAGEDARQAVVDAVIERAAGTERGLMLREILGKALRAGAAGALAISYSVPLMNAMETIVNRLYIVSSWRFRPERRKVPRALPDGQIDRRRKRSGMRLSYLPNGTPKLARFEVRAG